MTLFEVPKVPWLLRFMKPPGYLWNFPIGCSQGPLGASLSEVSIVPCQNIYDKQYTAHKKYIHANIVTNNFHSMVTLRHIIQYGKIHANIVTNNFHSMLTLRHIIKSGEIHVNIVINSFHSMLTLRHIIQFGEIHANIVTNNFHSMLTLGHIIQSGKIHANIDTNNFASFYNLLTTVKIEIWLSRDGELLVSQPFVTECGTFWAFLLFFYK